MKYAKMLVDSWTAVCKFSES